jgi:hypothetical protein
MKFLNIIKKEFNINWKTILTGLCENFNNISFISFEDMREFALDRLTMVHTDIEENLIIGLLNVLNIESNQEIVYQYLSVLMDSQYFSLNEKDFKTQIFNILPFEFNQKNLCFYLMMLARADKSDLVIEKRKWRVIKLKQTLEDISNNSLDGSLLLHKFWTEYDDYNNMPQIICEIEKYVSDYGSEKFFQKMLLEHYKWIDHEKNIIKQFMCD